MSEKDRPSERLGCHYLAEFAGCPADQISRVEHVESGFLDILRRHGASILGHTSHQFEPFGATVVVLLAESHASLHTWPENSAVCIDIFTCGDSLKAESALEELSTWLQADRQSISMVERVVP